jgi:acyl carrier protein
VILDKLIALICDVFALDESDVDEDTTLELFANDEFEIQELVSAIEEEFEVTLTEKPADDWTIRDLADAINTAG